MSENQFVLPGDVIVTGDYKLEQNVILEGNKVMSTAIGFSEIKNDIVSVKPLTGFYIPKTDDLVVGKIISYNAFSWEIDINSYYSGVLTASDIFGKDYLPSRDDLSLKLKIGDNILTRIVNIGSREPFLTIAGENLGKIDSGELIKISPTKIPRLIGKYGSMIQVIEASTNATITVGQNGLIVVSCEETNGLLKALAAVRMIDEQAHLVDLTDRVKKMLESNGV